MTVTPDIVFTIIIVGVGAVLLLAVSMVVGKLTQTIELLNAILAHQRMANGWPTQEGEKWKVLTETFDSRDDAVAFIKRHRDEGSSPNR